MDEPTFDEPLYALATPGYWALGLGGERGRYYIDPESTSNTIEGVLAYAKEWELRDCVVVRLTPEHVATPVKLEAPAVAEGMLF